MTRRHLDCDIADKRDHNGLVDALPSGFLHDVNQQVSEGHRRCNDRVPVAQDQGMHTRFIQGEVDGLAIGLRRFASSDVDRISGRPKGWMN